MFNFLSYNSFASDDYQLRKPRKKFLPRLPDMKNFNPTNSATLLKLGTFAMEFTKWIPVFESMYYAGDMHPEVNEDGESEEGVKIWHGEGSNRTSTEVTQEYYDEFNKYVVTDEINDVWAAYKENDPSKEEFWGSISTYDNINSIGAHEDLDSHKRDGFNDLRDTWVFGSRHHQPEFGPGSESGGGNLWAGKNFGMAYDNIDFYAGATDWSHIKDPDNEGSYIFNGNQAFFIGDVLEQLRTYGGSEWSDFTWSGINNWARDTFGNKNFYDIVLSMKNPESTFDDPKDALKLILLMRESRERIYYMQNTVFGPVSKTRNDSQMMHFVDDFCRTNLPYLNYHSVNFFLNIFRIQHSFNNFMAGFWMGYNERAGHIYARLDQHRFWNFSETLGANGFRCWLREEKNYEFNPGNEWKNVGRLYDAREQLSGLTASEYEDADSDDKQKFDFVDGIIQDWFGSFYPEWGRPVAPNVCDYGTVNGKIAPVYGTGYGSYSYSPRDNTSGSWEHIPSSISMPSGYGDWIFIPDYEHESLGYDRKFNENNFWIADNSSGSNTQDLSQQTSAWRKLHNHFYGSSIINESPAGNSHPAYACRQVQGMAATAITSGLEYNTNWVVHLVGELWKNGGGKGVLKMVWRWQQRRRNTREFRAERDAYAEAKDRIAYEKMIDNKLRAKRSNLRNRALKALEKKRKSRVTATNQMMNNAAQTRQDEKRRMAKTQENKSIERALQRKRGRRRKKA